MPHVVLAQAAQADLRRLHQFLAQTNPAAALRAVQTIRQAFKPLRQHPQVGRPVDDEPGLHEIVIDFGASGYLALYHYLPDNPTLVILTVKHQREAQYPQRLGSDPPEQEKD